MLFITGDIHGGIDIEKLNSDYFPQNKTLTKKDYLIVAGDFGLVWNDGNTEMYWRKWLQAKNFTTLFVDGNHENFDQLNRYPVEDWQGGKIHRVEGSIIHLMRGQVFEIDACKIFTFGGAQSTDKEYRIEHLSWWPEETPNKAEYQEGLINLERYGWDVDLVVTHTCSSSMLQLVNAMFNTGREATEINYYLEEIHQKLKYKHWYFGHFHQDYRFSGNQTLVYQKVLSIDHQQPIS